MKTKRRGRKKHPAQASNWLSGRGLVLIFGSVAAILLLGFGVWLFRNWSDLQARRYIASLDSASESKRNEMEENLVRLGQGAKKELVRALDDPHEPVRCAAVRILGKIEGDAGDLVPRLIAIMQNDPAHSVKQQACTVLVGWKETGVVPLLIAWLHQDNLNQRLFAAQALTNLGPLTNEVVPALTAALGDPDVAVRVAAVHGLSQGEGSPQLVTIFADRLADARENEQMKRAIIAALGRLGSRQTSAVAVLIQALQTPTLMGEAAEALGKIGPGAKSALQPLLQAERNVTTLAREEFAVRLWEAQNAAGPRTTTSYNNAQGGVVSSSTKGGLTPAAERALYNSIWKKWEPLAMQIRQAITRIQGTKG